MSLLSEGDQGLLLSPRARFEVELARLNLVRTRLVAKPVFGDAAVKAYAAQSQEGEITDLIDALLRLGHTDEQVLAISVAHQEQRQKLSTFQSEMAAWRTPGFSYGSEPDPEPKFPVLAPVRGLPKEFGLYFAGLISWHNPSIKDKARARESWTALLSLPPDQRRCKSVWAAFMIGKTWETVDPEKALACFRQARDLAQQGYKDTIGLATASVGLEARLELRRTNFVGAIDLYLEQLAAGDPTATNSLRFAAERALASGRETLVSLAKHPRAQRVITALVLSGGYSAPYVAWADEPIQHSANSADGLPEPSSSETPPPAMAWLEACETAGVSDVASSEMLALAAYQRGEMEIAERWIRKAPASPVVQWLRAKLLLRDGKVEAAAALLARIVQHFPLTGPDPAPLGLKDTLWVKGQYSEVLSAARLLHGELGVLRLARGEYVQSLDALLNAGIWADAAYVAERVLTLEELKQYVDSFWPPAEDSDTESPSPESGVTDLKKVRSQIRYLLARRLTRALRGDLAADYYAPEWSPKFAELATHLQTGWDETLDAGLRANALFQAALITRTNGLELIGTEVEPDWNIHAGQFEVGVTHQLRAGQVSTEQVHAQQDEIERARGHYADPEERFHYRYHAAALAWEAAQLLPDNSDQTARILWTGGTFLKNRDPFAADVFYKALVNRNRKTALGAAADLQRWFPRLDPDGNPLPRIKSPEPVEPLPEPPLLDDPAMADEEIQQEIDSE